MIEALAPYKEYLMETAGETHTALHRDTVLESTMDNFLLQGLLHTHDAHLAFSHGGRYAAPVPIGPVTINDLYNIIPMNPPLYSGEISGEPSNCSSARHVCGRVVEKGNSRLGIGRIYSTSV